jgi:hypothetical protein
MALRCRRVGAVHSIKRVGLTVRPSLPFRSDERTCLAALCRSSGLRSSGEIACPENPSKTGAQKPSKTGMCPRPAGSIKIISVSCRYCPRTVGALQCPIMPKKLFKRAGWPLRHDRELIMLAKTHSAQAIAEKFDRPITTILKRADQLGLSIRGKAKGK